MPPGQITACAVIGREHDVLVIRRPDGGWALPGARVEPGEAVEHALHRGVRQALGVGVSSVSFLCLVEEPGGLVVVFDVTPDTETEPETENAPPAADPPTRVWVAAGELAALDLRPAVLRRVLRDADPPVWLPRQTP